MNNEKMSNTFAPEILVNLQNILNAYFNKSEEEYINELKKSEFPSTIRRTLIMIANDLEQYSPDNYRKGNTDEKLIVTTSEKSDRNLNDNFDDCQEISDDQLITQEEKISLLEQLLEEASNMDVAKDSPASLERFLEESKYMEPAQNLDEVVDELWRRQFTWIKEFLPNDFKKWEKINPTISDFENAVFTAREITLGETGCVSSFIGEVFDQYKDKTLETLIDILQKNRSLSISDSEIREELIDKLKQLKIKKFKIINNTISL